MQTSHTVKNGTVLRSTRNIMNTVVHDLGAFMDMALPAIILLRLQRDPESRSKLGKVAGVDNAIVIEIESGTA